MKLIERLEALLARLDETTDGEYLDRLANGHAIALQCMEFVRDHGPALAELARRVEDAPAADIREDGGESALLSAATRAGYYQGQRVRLVPEAGQGGGE